jgi:hypothetical protein
MFRCSWTLDPHRNIRLGPHKGSFALLTRPEPAFKHDVYSERQKTLCKVPLNGLDGGSPPFVPAVADDSLHPLVRRKAKCVMFLLQTPRNGGLARSWQAADDEERCHVSDSRPSEPSRAVRPAPPGGRVRIENRTARPAPSRFSPRAQGPGRPPHNAATAAATSTPQGVRAARRRRRGLLRPLPSTERARGALGPRPLRHRSQRYPEFSP